MNRSTFAAALTLALAAPLAPALAESPWRDEDKTIIVDRDVTVYVDGDRDHDRGRGRDGDHHGGRDHDRDWDHDRDHDRGYDAYSRHYVGYGATSGIHRGVAIRLAQLQGVDTVTDVDFERGVWEIEGLTRHRQRIEVDILGRNGRVLDVDYGPRPGHGGGYHHVHHHDRSCGH